MKSELHHLRIVNWNSDFPVLVARYIYIYENSLIYSLNKKQAPNKNARM